MVRCPNFGEVEGFHIDADAGEGDFIAGGVELLVAFGRSRASVGKRAKDLWKRHLSAP